MQENIYVKPVIDEQLISIIVPVYKVEKYLDSCVSSIVNQKYKNLDIILIDDGSPDGCPELCDQWAARDERITVIHQQNAGLSGARNAGMRVAKGEYIAFVDSDDQISDVCISLMYEEMLVNGADVVGCQSTTDLKMLYSSSVMDKLNVKFQITENPLLFYLENENAAVWHRLYRRDLLRDLEFEVGEQNEDIMFSYQVFKKSQKYVTLNCKLYYWNLIPSSLSRSAVKSIKNQASRVVDDLVENDAEQAIIDAAKVHRDLFIYRIVTRVNRFGIENKYIQEEFEGTLDSNLAMIKRDISLILKSNRFRVIDKIQILLMSFSYNLYRIIYVMIRNKLFRREDNSRS